MSFAQSLPAEHTNPAPVRPSYARVFLTLASNSLVRAMTFRGNFLIECVSSAGWVVISLAYYTLIFEYTESIGEGTGWGKYEFFAFLATTLLIGGFVEALFMPNAEEFSELVRTGGLDFALVKPIDTQFLISLHRIDLSAIASLAIAILLLGYSVARLPQTPGPAMWLLYAIYLVCGVAIYYSLMIALAGTSVWLGRNQSLYEFWFYITNFARYPMEIYRGPIGRPLKLTFTFIVPLLVASNVPARLVALPLSAQSWPLALFTLAATAVALLASRAVFSHALASYRSASS